jgi:hypothetical protein
MSKETALAIPPRGEIIGFNVESLMEKAIDAKSAVEVLERLQAMRREIRAEQAKESFDKAMADFQAKCPIIEKKKAGARNAYRFAPLDAIVVQVRELIREHGFSFTISSDVQEGWVKALCKVTHSMGHSEISEFKAPVDNKNPMMTDPQRYGGSMTFAKRYAFCNAFGILTADEDCDAGDKPKAPGPSMKVATDDVANKKVLVDLTRDVHCFKPGYNLPAAAKRVLEQWLIEEAIITDTEKLSDLQGERLAQVVAKVKENKNGKA